MMKCGTVGLLLSLTVGCKQGDASGPSELAAAPEDPATDVRGQEESVLATAHESQRGLTPAKRAALERSVKERFGDQAHRSEEERELIAFVEEFIETSKIAIPKPRGHVVVRKGDGWNVTAMDLASLLRAERPIERTYHVRKIGSRLEITHGLAP